MNRYLLRVKWSISGRAKTGAAVNCLLVVLGRVSIAVTMTGERLVHVHGTR